MLLLVFVELVVFGNVVCCRKEETPGAAGGIADDLARLWLDAVDDGVDDASRGEILPGPALGVLGVSFQEALVSVALNVG